MHQTDKIISMANELGLDTGSSSNSADNLRYIAQQVGIEDFNSITDINKLEETLKDMLQEESEAIPDDATNYNRSAHIPEDNTINNANNRIQNRRLDSARNSHGHAQGGESDEEAESTLPNQDNYLENQQTSSSTDELTNSETAEGSSADDGTSRFGGLRSALSAGSDAKSKIAGNLSKNKMVSFFMKHPSLIVPAIIVFSVVVLVFFIIIAVVASDTEAEASEGGVGTGTYNTANATPTDACAQISVPLNEYLESKSSSLESFNNYIASEVRTAGLGTRNGVVAAAISLVGGLCQNFGARLPYAMGGAHPANFYGVPLNAPNSCNGGADKTWGAKVNSGSGAMMCGFGPYFYYGPDCSGFVAWAIHNGGYRAVSLAAADFGTLGPSHSMTSFTGQPGDILYNSHHVVMIVGVSGDSYTIAEASSGENGTRITTISKNSNAYQVVDMTSFYENDANKDMASYPEATPISTGDNSNSPSGSANLFIGDSRTVGMCEEFGLCGNTKYVAEVGMGYNWLESTAIAEANSILQSSDKYNIYILLGANDYDYQANNYIKKVNELASGEWKDHNIIFVSVGPFSSDSENSKVESFNQTLKSGLSSSVKYCDIYSSLKSGGFNTTDGTHYDKATYEKMFSLVKSC